jgi:hypothetical protein
MNSNFILYNSVPDGNWEDWGSDWNGYQNQTDSAPKSKNSGNASSNSKNGPRKSDDWSWDD